MADLGSRRHLQGLPHEWPFESFTWQSEKDMMATMNVSQALEQLNEIHHHLGRSEVYRGYRSKTIALTGLSGLLAAAGLAYFWPEAGALERIGFWVAVAALNLAVVAWEVLGDYDNHRTAHQRKVSRRTVGQFLPALALGAVLTAAMASRGESLDLLPGLWAGLFALGIFSSRPYLPRGVGWVGAYYLAAASILLSFETTALAWPWAMGGAFGIGQALMAYVLYQNLERTTS